MMRKGITPIISIIVLLLITVALAGVAWTYLSGFLTTQMATITVPPNGAFCNGTALKVIITNTGQEKIVTLTALEASGTGTTAGQTFNPTNKTVHLKGEQSIPRVINCDASSCLPGSYTIHVATAGSVQNVPVVCS